MTRRHLALVLLVASGTAAILIFRKPTVAAPPAPAILPTTRPSASTPPPPPPPLPPEETGRIIVKVTASGIPAPGAMVTFFGPREVIRITSLTGECPLDGAEPGTWRVVARVANHAPATVPAEAKKGETTRISIDLVEGCRLEGHVRDSDGAPVQGARVVFTPQEHLIAVADSQGHYLVENIPLGTYDVTATSDRLRPNTRPQISFIAPGQKTTQDFVLSAGTRIAGIVLDEGGGPVAGASVLVSNEVARVGKSDAGGRFEITGLGEGPLSMTVIAPGFGNYVKRDLRPNTTDVSVTMLRGCAIRGEVVAGGGPPQKFVAILRKNEAVPNGTGGMVTKWLIVKSDNFGAAAKGVFQMKDLTVGVYELSIEAAGSMVTGAPVGFTLLQPGQGLDVGVVRLEPK